MLFILLTYSYENILIVVYLGIYGEKDSTRKSAEGSRKEKGRGGSCKEESRSCKKEGRGGSSQKEGGRRGGQEEGRGGGS